MRTTELPTRELTQLHDEAEKQMSDTNRTEEHRKQCFDAWLVMHTELEARKQRAFFTKQGPRHCGPLNLTSK